MPKVSVITPSFNKAKYVVEAITSVMKQSLEDFEYWIIENSTEKDAKRAVHELVKGYQDRRLILVDEYFAPEQRQQAYPTAVILNKYFDCMRGEYVFYLSDDDLIAPNCLQAMVEPLEAHPDWMVVYAGLEDIAADGHLIKRIDADRVIYAPYVVDCVLDGGQVMIRKSAFGQVEKPYYDENPLEPVARHCDGTFLTKFSTRWNFYPVNQLLITHRRTPLSAWTK